MIEPIQQTKKNRTMLPTLSCYRKLRFLLSSEKCQIRSLSQDVIPFQNNIIYQNTIPISLETEAHTIHTILLIREHCDP